MSDRQQAFPGAAKAPRKGGNPWGDFRRDFLKRHGRMPEEMEVVCDILEARGYGVPAFSYVILDPATGQAHKGGTRVFTPGHLPKRYRSLGAAKGVLRRLMQQRHFSPVPVMGHSRYEFDAEKTRKVRAFVGTLKLVPYLAFPVYRRGGPVHP